MMIRVCFILFVSLAAFLGTGLSPAHGQAAQFSEAGEGPIDISAANFEVFDQENRMVYSGDVNAVRGLARIRADQIEVFFQPQDGPGFGPISRLAATGDVFYVTPTEVIRADRGDYNVQDEVITMIGNVILTQGCNVSTGYRLLANLQTGIAELIGSNQTNGGRVRSVFFPDQDNQAGSNPSPQNCPTPDIPGDGPRPFEG